MDEIKSKKPLVMHVPIGKSKESPPENTTILGNETVEKEELEGFYAHLKETDFQRYLQETGQEIKDVVKKIQSLWQAASKAGTEKKHAEAIGLYTEIVGIWPRYYEAFDNRGIQKMEMAMSRNSIGHSAELESAMNDFKESMRIHSQGVHAPTFAGECLIRMGKTEESIAYFARAIAIDPLLRKNLTQFLPRLLNSKENAAALLARIDVAVPGKKTSSFFSQLRKFFGKHS